MKNKVIAGTLVTLFSIFGFASSSFASYEVENQNKTTSTYEYVVDKIDNTLDSVKSFILPSASADNGITYSGGVVTFTSETNKAIEKGVQNALSNGWAGFLLLLPYIGTFLGVTMVIGVITFLIIRRRS